MATLDEVLSLSGRNLSVIPLHGPHMPLRSGWTERESGKLPLIGWRQFQSKPADPSVIQCWWEEWPEANVGVVTGSTSNLIVLDIDGPEGSRSLAKFGPLPKTWRSVTGRGAHLWFRHPGGRISNRAGLLPGVDLRGDGGYVVAPPSLHHSGQPYRWEDFEDPLPADPPQWLLDLLRSTSAISTGEPVLSPPDIPEGTRNNELYRLARRLRRTGLSPAGIEQALQFENEERCKPPLPRSEVALVVRNAFQQPDRDDFHPSKEPDSFPSPKEELGKGRNFCPLRAGDFMTQVAEPIKWLWEPFIPQGALVLLTAFMKVGKSTLLYPLSLAIARGSAFLGYATSKSAVLVAALEEHSRDVSERLRELGVTLDDNLYVFSGRLSPDHTTLAQIREFIAQYEIKLLVIDTLSQFWRVKDENDNAEVVRRLSPVLDLARETECAVLLVHHHRKSGGEDGTSIRGGGALLGMVDQALMLERCQGGNRFQRTLKCLGRYQETPSELLIELRDGEYIAIGTPKEASCLDQDQQVRSVLGEQGQTVEEIVTRTGLSKKAVRASVSRLASIIRKEGAGTKGAPFRYSLGDHNSFPSQPAL